MNDKTSSILLLLFVLTIILFTTPWVDTHCVSKNGLTTTHTFIWQNRTAICGEANGGSFCHGLDINCQLSNNNETKNITNY